ncbi:MAG: PKD domain-containing protein [Planctomycetota bacterium]|jgi:hypothetical protein
MPFAIRAISEGTAKVQAGGSQELKFEVTNLSDEDVKTRFRILDPDGNEPAWASVAGEAIRDLKSRELMSVDVEVSLPADTEIGANLNFRLFVNDTTDVRNVGEGPQTTVRVTDAPAPTPMPIWPFIVGGVVLLLVVAVVLFFALRDSGGGEQLKAAIEASTKSGKAPLKVTFEDVSTGDVKGRTWRFGDTNKTVTGEDTVEHTFMKPGSYPVTLEIEGKTDDPANKSATVQIEVVHGVAAKLLWSVSKTRAVVNRRTRKKVALYTVQFVAQSTGGPIRSYHWGFGGNKTAKNAAPLHEFNAGSHTITLTVKGDGGGNEQKITQKITVPPNVRVAHTTGFTKDINAAVAAANKKMGIAKPK